MFISWFPMLEGQIKLNNRGLFDTPKQDDRSKILSGNLEDKVVVNIVGKNICTILYIKSVPSHAAMSWEEEV